MSTKPCCNDMKAYRIDFWSRILPANPVTNWIQVCEDHGSSIQVDSSKDDGLIEVNAKVTFILGRVDTCMFAATAALCQHTTPFSSEANDRSLYSVIVQSRALHPILLLSAPITSRLRFFLSSYSWFRRSSKGFRGPFLLPLTSGFSREKRCARLSPHVTQSRARSRAV
jgi:hypothetical protein